MSIADQLTYLAGTKTAIRNSLVNKGLPVLESTPFREYSSIIDEAGSLVWSDTLYQSYLAYDRSPEWLTWTPVTSSDEKIVILLAIYTDFNHISFNMSGAYTVDWGDSTTDNYATGITASHSYNYSSISDTTLTSYGYKQVIITITPQAGQNLTSVSFNYKHALLPSAAFGANYLEIDMSVPYATTINYCQTRAIYLSSLEVIRLHNHALTTFGNLFKYCTALESIPILFQPIDITNFSYMFSYCTNLPTVPFLDLKKGIATTVTGLFTDCKSMVILPALDTSDIFNFTNMFYNCTSLLILPNLSYASATSLYGLFYGCSSLRDIPPIVAPLCTEMAYMFYNCLRLTTIEFVSFSTSTTILTDSMFYGCSSLKNVIGISTLKVSTCRAMFQLCYSLKDPPYFDTSASLSFASMFSGCLLLYYIPDYNTDNVQDYNSTFSGCTNLRVGPDLNLSKATSLQSMFSSCTGLISTPAYITTNVLQYTNNMFSGCTSLTSPGLFETTSVLEANLMFNSCTNLVVLPSYNWTNAQSCYRLCYGCSKLTTVGNLTFTKLNASGTSGASEMFVGCTVLATVGNITGTFTSTAYLYNTFNGCSNLLTVGSISLQVTGAGATLYLSQMFNGCSKLNTVISVVLSSTSTSSSTASNLFYGCILLSSITVSITGIWHCGSMFYNCRELLANPVTQMGKVSNTSYMFYSCLKMEGSINLSNEYTSTHICDYMFYNCPKITSITYNHIGLISSCQYMFYNCTLLTSIRKTTGTYVDSAIDFSSVSNLSFMFSLCPALTDLYIKNAKLDLSVANTAIAHTMINNIADSLYSFTPGPITKTLTFTGTPAASDANVAITKAKITARYWYSLPA